MHAIETAAQRQYYSRPADERYATLQAYHEAAHADRAACRTARAPLSALRVEPAPDGVQLRGSTMSAGLTPWAYGQLCSTLGAPVAYLRRQDPELQAQCLTADLTRYQLSDPDAASDPRKLLIRNGSTGAPTIRAFTSSRYSRLWDADIADLLLQAHDRRPALDLPPVWEGGRGGAYRSDRDSFVLLTDGGSIVTDPTIGSRGDGRMFRGVIVVNSEVGASTYRHIGFWLRSVCGNLLLSGVETVVQLDRRHVGRGFLPEVAGSFVRLLRWLDRPESEDRRIIDAMLDARLGNTEQDAARELTRILKGLPGSTATAALQRAAQTEPGDPFTYWAAWQGLTRISQDAGHMGDRFDLDLLAAQLQRRALRVAA